MGLCTPINGAIHVLRKMRLFTLVTLNRRNLLPLFSLNILLISLPRSCLNSTNASDFRGGVEGRAPRLCPVSSPVPAVPLLRNSPSCTWESIRFCSPVSGISFPRRLFIFPRLFINASRLPFVVPEASPTPNPWPSGSPTNFWSWLTFVASPLSVEQKEIWGTYYMIQASLTTVDVDC